jgi:hypothetical protein
VRAKGKRTAREGRKKSMRKAVVPFVLSMGLIAVWASPADAATTRAEYIAQVDPICQSFVGPVNGAAKTYRKNFKEWERRLTKGTLKAWVRQTDRTFRSLRRLVQLDAGLTDQIAAATPPPEDAGTVNAWLTNRNKSERWAYSAALAFGGFKFDRFYKLIDRAIRFQDAAFRTISGFGFQVCGVSV